MRGWRTRLPAMRFGLILLCAAVMTAAAGCTPLATWPPVSGKPPLVPSAAPCPQCMASAVQYTRQNATPQAPLVFNLPPGTDARVWYRVQKQLGPDARPMQAGDQSAFSVLQLRLDGGQAEVDVVYRTPEGVWQMATVHFKGWFGGPYRPTYFQRWLIPVDAPSSNAPTPEDMAMAAYKEGDGPKPAAGDAPAAAPAEGAAPGNAPADGAAPANAPAPAGAAAATP